MHDEFLHKWLGKKTESSQLLKYLHELHNGRSKNGSKARQFLPFPKQPAFYGRLRQKTLVLVKQH